MEKIGFIGLGIMGAPMAGHLLDAGYEVLASDHRGAPPAALTAKGLRTVTGHQALAKTADVIIMMVPDTPQVADVLFGDYKPTGKLPRTWPATNDQVTNSSADAGKPLFPYGFGLTYNGGAQEKVLGMVK